MTVARQLLREALAAPFRFTRNGKTYRFGADAEAQIGIGRCA